VASKLPHQGEKLVKNFVEGLSRLLGTTAGIGGTRIWAPRRELALPTDAI